MDTTEHHLAGAPGLAANALKTGVTVALVTLIIDQLHKWMMISVMGLTLGQRVEVTPFMDFIYVLNKGISYGLFTQDDASGQYVLSGFACIVALGLAVWLMRSPHTRLSAWSVGLVIGGAVGNAIDRLHLGGVADFISLHAFGFYWYIFNVADVAIVAGVVGLLYDSYKTSRNSAAKES